MLKRLTKALLRETLATYRTFQSSSNRFMCVCKKLWWYPSRLLTHQLWGRP